MDKMTLKTEGDRHVVVKRRFAAPPEAVYSPRPARVSKGSSGPSRSRPRPAMLPNSFVILVFGK